MPTALIADDEPLLRAHLRAKLAALWPELQVTMEAEHGRHALQLIESAGDVLPDIAFLDIHMPGASGLDVARAIGRRVHIVFITAFDQYAVEAFDRGAIDYILKPFEEARLADTITRLKERLASRAMSTVDFDKLVQELKSSLAPSHGASYLQWIKASIGQTVRLIPVEEIFYFHADEKYTCVVLENSEVLIRKPIKELIAELDPEHFWQIHRATIVNSRAIAGVVRGLRDQADLKLKGRPETLTVSRNFTHLFKQM